MTFPLTIADWRDCFLRRGAMGAVEIWLNKLGAVDAATQRAALTTLPSLPMLQRRFIDAWELRDEPLGGVPFLAKDLFSTQGDATGAGSRFLASLLGPAAADACVIAHAKHAGAVLCGKTQLNEFALGMSGENPHFGDCPHPARADLLSGGSSSGSAWAVGAGLVPFAFATDTSGSIRVPAAFCGIYGVRLQPGLLNSSELFPLSPSFDTPGWFTKNATDLRLVSEILLDVPPLAPAPARRLWIPCDGTTSPEVRVATENFAHGLGFVSHDEISREFDNITHGVEKSYAVLGANEAAHLHERMCGGLLEKYKASYDPIVWQRLDAGRRRTPQEIKKARGQLAKIQAFFKNIFENYDVIALPTTPVPAQPKSGQTEALRNALLRLNAPASMAALPALTVPVPLPDGLTTGVQFIFPSINNLCCGLGLIAPS